VGFLAWLRNEAKMYKMAGKVVFVTGEEAMNRTFNDAFKENFIFNLISF